MIGTKLAFRFLGVEGLITASNCVVFGVAVVVCLELGFSSCSVYKSILRNVCHKRISSFSCGCSRNNHLFIYSRSNFWYLNKMKTKYNFFFKIFSSYLFRREFAPVIPAISSRQVIT